MDVPLMITDPKMDEEKGQLLRTLGLSIIDNDRRKEVKVQHMTS